MQVQKLQRASLTDPVKVEVSKKYQTVEKLQQHYLFIPLKLKVSIECFNKDIEKLEKKMMCILCIIIIYLHADVFYMYKLGCVLGSCFE